MNASRSLVTEDSSQTEDAFSPPEDSPPRVLLWSFPFPDFFRLFLYIRNIDFDRRLCYNDVNIKNVGQDGV